MPETEAIAAYWNDVAASFDDEADHGLRDPRVRSAWTHRLRAWLPRSSAELLDLGCGTGSLSLLAAELGHRVVGVDVSVRMVEEARRKLSRAGLDTSFEAGPEVGFEARFVVGDAGDPPDEVSGPFDVVLARHLLWTLPSPAAALRRWVGLLRPGGRLVLIEGRWAPQGEWQMPYVPGAGELPWAKGVTAYDLEAAVRPLVQQLRVEALREPELWGREITDERYAMIAWT